MKIVGYVVCQYLEKYPNLPSKTIARMMHKAEPKLFHNVEHARGIIRTYRGQSGKYNLNKLTDKRFCKAAGKTDDGCIKLPEPISELTDWKVQQVAFDRALIISDIHIPFHDKVAVETAIKHGKKLKVDCVILDGDIMDFHSVSAWERDPRMRVLEDEVQAGRLFLEYIRERFPKAQIIYKEGNHEERLWRHCIRCSPETYNLTDGNGNRLLGLDVIMDLKEYGIRPVGNKQPILCGEHLYVLHGHEFRAPFVNPVNPARGLFLRAKANALCGDLHQSSTHSEAGIEKVTSCWSIGCLCNMRPQYMPLNKWNHGFAIVHLDGRRWSVENHKIIEGAVV